MVDEVLAIVHTCGKALASVGAFVCSGQTLKRLLINRARTFIFSTAMPPYVAHQIRAALRISMEAEAERGYLDAMARRLRGSLQASGFNTGTSTSQIVPVFLGDNETALYFAGEVGKSGFSVRAIRPPTVSPGTSRLRVSLTSAHTTEQMDRLVAAVIAARETLGSALHA
jgi:8-amino-7-oxononanoate synthase